MSKYKDKYLSIYKYLIKIEILRIKKFILFNSMIFILLDNAIFILLNDIISILLLNIYVW